MTSDFPGHIGKNPLDFIVTRAPFRISFAGGGSDLPSFYERDYGAVLSTTIDKYVYVVINQCRPLLDRGIDDKFRYRIRLSYATTENVNSPDQLEHPLVREAFKLLDLDVPMDIATMADVPAGTGLGSSATFSVALLQALHLVKGEEASPEQLASEAAHIEINSLGRPVGKQDHYATAFGGMNTIKFFKNGNVTVSPIGSQELITGQLFPNLMLFYTGTSRNAGEVLQEQKQNVDEISSNLTEIRDHAHQLEELIRSDFSLERLGELLHSTWLLKRDLASGITTKRIDDLYQKSLQAGALGGKISGAGGGGFLLLVVKTESQNEVRNALSDLSELSVNYEPSGSKTVFPSF